MADISSRAVGPQFTTAIFDRIALDRYTIVPSILGDLRLAWTARGASAVRLVEPAADETDFANWYTARTGRSIVRAVEVDRIAEAARAALGDLGRVTEVALDLCAATLPERAVFAAVARIRRGYARPIDLLAADCGMSSASAVATMLARNPIPLLIPCHRVVASDKPLGTYVFGSAAQRRLLTAEGLDIDAIGRVFARGIRYIADADGWFCLPTCGDIAQKIDRPGYVGLTSLADVRARGLHACESCRPVAA